MTNVSVLLANKRTVLSAMHTIAEANPESVAAELAKIYHPQAQWRGSHPWNELQGVEAIANTVWQPLLHSFPDLERRDDIVIGGEYEGRDCVGAVGQLVGSFKHDWNGMPATDQVISLRYGEIIKVSTADGSYLGRA